ncbi:MAG: Tex family protein [Erysipelotrichaceae bacterium]|nr:Tex family protein [Erysipelotrichaceae bacterium]
MEELIKPIALALKVKELQVSNTLKLLSEGNTVPFIARYRKEMTGSLDEEQILFVKKEYEYECNLKKRKEDVLRLIEATGKLTDEIVRDIENAKKLSEVEDIYRPYQQKRKTRATEAKRKGLEPLYELIMKMPRSGNLETEARKYLNDEVKTVNDALDGAKDIIAESVADNAKIRAKIKDSILNYGVIVTKVKKNNPDENGVYQMYYDREEKVKYLKPHRIMAIERAEDEKVITVSFNYDKDYISQFAKRGIIKNRESIGKELIEEAIDDGLKRLAYPSVEREIRGELSEEAKKQSIEVFSMNLEKLLLQPPLKSKRILGFDPAFRTGCKLAVLDETGKMLKIDKIFPHEPVNKKKEAEAILLKLIKDYDIEIIAIGNGTASRESESFVSAVIKRNNLNVEYTIVSEAGASVYSASEIARKEFPDLHVEERSAVSIGRRVQDPLSELIKIDPKSIGVGQYQHDLPLKELNERLDFAILKTVNRVGADVNTASKELLKHISGLNNTTAEAIINYRFENGRFKNREELLKVKKVTKKVYEQSIGFLRISDGDMILDRTSIHPESYDIALKIIELCDNETIGTEAFMKKANSLDVNELAKTLGTDEYTLNDIVDALKAPLRDYRDNFDGPVLRSDILEITDLKKGDKLQGVVRNVVDFGAFVDIGLHDDGLVHISKMSKERIGHPSEVLAVGDIIDVYVADIDLKRNKVQLSLMEI